MTRDRLARWTLAAVLAGSLIACGGGGPVEERVAVMELDPADGITFTYGAVDVGDRTSALVSILDTGDAHLEISSITLDYEPANPALEAGPYALAFELQFNPGEAPPRTVAFQGAGTPTLPEVYVFKVSVTNLGDDLPRSAHVVITSNDHDTPVLRLPVTAVSGVPRVRVTPDVVEFGPVGQDATRAETVVVRNAGTADLVLDRFVFTGSDRFSFEHDGASVRPDEVTANGVDFVPPIVLAGDASIELRFVFAPQSEHPADATFVLFSNDPAARDGTVVQLHANRKLPCLQVTPTQVDFGAAEPGSRHELPVEICNCGTNALAVTGLAIANDTSGGAFSVSLESLVPVGSEAVVSVERPLVLSGGECVTVPVSYAPSELSFPGADGAPIPDTAGLAITSDAFTAYVEVPLRGVATDVLCPTARIRVDEGDQVIPQTVLHLFGDQSSSPNGAIASYEWTVTQPTGSVSHLIPTGTFPNPLFEANVAGVYVFTLEVVDGTGVRSCYPASVEVFVVPDEALHVELLWDTPGDPDPSDEGPAAGTDLDLHFAHPFAAGPDKDGDGQPDPWFSDPYDVYWFNREPAWGSLDPSVDDDPGLDRDDTDGGGPENVNLNVPEDGNVYRVGVHYWDDRSFGESFATVRVYVSSTLLFDVRDVRLVPRDLWDVCTIRWPEGLVEPVETVEGQPKITPNY